MALFLKVVRILWFFSFDIYWGTWVFWIIVGISNEVGEGPVIIIRI